MNLFNFFKSSSKNSKDIAKDRLKLVLIHDRGDLAPDKRELIKKDLIEVLSKYVEVDVDNIDISIVNRKDSQNDSYLQQFTANANIKKIL